MPAPVRQRLLTFLTPRTEDALIAETADISRQEIPEFGSAHPDKEKYPDHRFAHAIASDDKGLIDTFLYIREFRSQDSYNFEHLAADVEGTKFSTVIREYVTLRSEFNPALPLMGASMPDTPKSLFGTGSGDPRVLTDYYLAIRQQRRSGDRELDNLFVLDRHTYIKRAPIRDIDVDKQLGIGVGKTTTLHYRGEVMTGSSTIETLAAAPTNAYWGIQADGTDRSMQQISDNWWAVIVSSSRDAALTDYKLILPTTTNLNLPDVLESIAVVWNTAGGNGNFDSNWVGLAHSIGGIQNSLGGGESASAEGAASVQPELSISIRQPLGRNIPALAYFFYLKLTSADTITSAEFLAKLTALAGASVSYWPSFNPVSHTIVLKGQKVAVSAKASASASMQASDAGDVDTISTDKNEGSGTSYDTSTMNGVTRIPPTIHGAISITGGTTSSATATASCDVGWTGTGSGASIGPYPVTFPSTTAVASASLAANGAVSPTSLSATSPASIPSSGLYITESRIDPYEKGWVRCYAEVIDASDI